MTEPPDRRQRGLTLLIVTGLAVVIAAPAFLSSSDLWMWARVSLHMGPARAVVVPVALDCAALVCIALTWHAISRGESAGLARLGIAGFALGSAAANYRHGSAISTDASVFFPFMSVGAVLILEAVLRRFQHAVLVSQDRVSPPLPRFGVLRWSLAPGETFRAWRYAVREGISQPRAAIVASHRMMGGNGAQGAVEPSQPGIVSGSPVDSGSRSLTPIMSGHNADQLSQTGTANENRVRSDRTPAGQAQDRTGNGPVALPHNGTDTLTGPGRTDQDRTGPDRTADQDQDRTGPDRTADQDQDRTGPDRTADQDQDRTGPDRTADQDQDRTGPDRTADQDQDRTGPDRTADDDHGQADDGSDALQAMPKREALALAFDVIGPGCTTARALRWMADRGVTLSDGTARRYAREMGKVHS